MLWAKGTDLWKIGFTQRAVAHRAAVIQSQSPIDLLIVAECPGTQRDERDLHVRLRRFRVRNEWFDLPEDEVFSLWASIGARGWSVMSAEGADVST